MPSSQSSQPNTSPFTTVRPDSYAVSAPTERLKLARANAPSAGTPLPDRKKCNKAAKSKPGKHIFKSPSHPHLQGAIMSDPELDKKRNKLGYQRISIACAHCRRRKIRCLVAEDDTENRCQNCIRLKKECVFYPVDQQVAMDARSEASSKTGEPPGPPSAVSSSPAHIGSSTFEQQRHHFGAPYHNMPPPEVGNYGTPIAPSGAVPPQVGYPSQEYGYYTHREQPGPWNEAQMNAQSQAVPVSAPSSMAPPYQRYENASIRADTAPFPETSDQPHPVAQHHVGGYSYTPEPMQQQWQPPPQQAGQPRSMPYPEIPGSNAYSPALHQGLPPPGAYGQAPPAQAGPRGMPMHAHTLPARGHPYQYPAPPDPRSSSIPAGTGYQPPQQMPSAWYSQSAYPTGEQNPPANFGRPA